MARAAQTTPVRPALLVAALALGVTTLSLLQTLVVPVLGAIAEQLRVSPGAAGWVLTANLLAAAVLTPVLGRLGDLRGERPVILGILLAVAVGTVLAIVATSLPLLLVGRILQGASYGLFPLSISVLRRELPAARLSVAMSVVSSMLGVGGIIGLVATGLLAGDGADYRRPFWIGLAVTLLSLALVRPVPARAAGHRVGAGRLVGRPGARRRPRAAPPAAVAGPRVGLGIPGDDRLPGRSGAHAGRLGRPPAADGRAARPPRDARRPAHGRPEHRRPHDRGRPVRLLPRRPLSTCRRRRRWPATGSAPRCSRPPWSICCRAAVAGILIAPVAGRLVTRCGALPTLLAGAALGAAGFALLAVLRGTPWVVVVAGAAHAGGGHRRLRRAADAGRPGGAGRRRPAWPTRSTRSPGRSARPWAAPSPSRSSPRTSIPRPASRATSRTRSSR